MKMSWLDLIYPFCGVFIVLGATLAYSTLHGILKGRTVSSWPTTNAKVNKVDFNYSADGEGGKSFEVLVNYQYVVDDVIYENTKIHPAYSESSFSGHHGLYERLKIADVVAAHYNPRDPAEAYIVSGSYSAHWSAFFAGFVFLAAGVGFMLGFHFAIRGNSDYGDGLHIIRKAGALQVAVPAEEK